MSPGSDIEVPKVAGYAVSIDREPLTVYPNPFDEWISAEGEGESG